MIVTKILTDKTLLWALLRVNLNQEFTSNELLNF
jgi:hypothetical protein